MTDNLKPIELAQLLSCAAENLRSADKTERRVDAAFRIAYQLDEVARELYRTEPAGSAEPIAEPVAYAVVSERGGIHKLAIKRDSAERKAEAWQKEWPNNACRVRPLQFADAALSTQSTHQPDVSIKAGESDMEKERERFEKWYAARNDGFVPPSFEGEYDWADAQPCWLAWLAAKGGE